MSNEELYLQASSEVDGENKNSALWAKAITLCEGNEEKAKYSYIKLRVEQLESIKLTVKPAFIEPMPAVKKAVPKPVVRKDLPGISVTKQAREKNVGTVAKFKLSKKLFDVIERNYIPVKEFADREGFSPEKVIQMIQGGLHHGHLVDGRWYVKKGENMSNNKDFEELKKEAERDGLKFDSVNITLGEKIGSFVIWGIIILFIVWLFK